MSMIEVEGSKSRTQESDPAQRYVLKNEGRKSNTPAVLSVLLMGVALYLKSIFPSTSRDVDAKPAAEAEPEGKAEPQIALTESSERPPLDEAPTGTTPEEDGPVGSSGNIIRPMPPVEFMRIESPKVDFTPLEVDRFWHDFKVPPVYGNAANDNSGGGGLPGIDFPDDGGTGPTGTDDEDVDPNGPGDDEDDDNTNPVDPTDPGDGDCPSGCHGDPCDEDPTEDPCGENENPNAGNRAPRVAGSVYLMDVSGCAILTIGLTDLLRNAVDPDGDMLSVRNLTVSSGTLTQSGDGWVFQGRPQLLGPVTITYEITDGEFTVGQTAHFSVIRSFVGGTDEDDILLGTMCADDIDGGDWDDNIDGRAGSDVIVGGNGDDHIFAGLGDDVVFGGAGDDIVFGGAGNDHISGGAGNDRLFGEDGDDIVFGDAGDDHLSGGSGDDLLSGGDGKDVIEGGAGDDTIVAGAGDDIAEGGFGNDSLSGGDGGDLLSGGDGNDTVYGDAGDDCISGGNGNDVLAGGDGDDVVDGNAGNDRIYGGAGDDILNGGTGKDTIIDGDGEDIVNAGAGNDRVVVALDGDSDRYDGGEGCDTLDYSATSEGVTVNLLNGTACGVEIGDDTISGFETVVGGSGDDLFIIGDKSAVLTGGDGENTFEFVPASGADPVLHEILDFKVGDLIRMSKYDIFERVLDELEDRFEEIYGDDIDEDDIPIRFRYDTADEVMRTVIETDFDNDEIYETTISLHGHHVLVISEQA